MPSYTWRCTHCDGVTLTNSHDANPICHDEMMRRDYRADAPNLNLSECRKARA